MQTPSLANCFIFAFSSLCFTYTVLTLSLRIAFRSSSFRVATNLESLGNSGNLKNFEIGNENSGKMKSMRYNRERKCIPSNFSLKLLMEKFGNALEISGKTQEI